MHTEPFELYIPFHGSRKYRFRKSWTGWKLQVQESENALSSYRNASLEEVMQFRGEVIRLYKYAPEEQDWRRG